MYDYVIKLRLDFIYRANMSKRKGGGDIRHYFDAKKRVSWNLQELGFKGW